MVYYGKSLDMKRLLILLTGLMLVGAGCAPTKTVELPTAPPEETASVTAPTAPPAPAAEAPSTAPKKKSYYVAFTKAQYEKAKAEGRPILLYFYASWCPICRDEEPRVKADVEASDVPIAGFRVHFNDPETDADATVLAQAFKIVYQHTSVFLDTKGNEVDRITGPVDSSTRNEAIHKAAK